FSFREHDTFIVGRSKQAHFRLPSKDKAFSRFHFMVEVNPPCCRLIDMASCNGTRVNGRKVSVVDLNGGDTIRGGRATLTVSIRPDPDRPRSSPEIMVTRADVPVPMAAPALAAAVATPTVESRPTAASPGVGAGWRVRGYQLEHELGEGGMGVVYRA